MKKVLLIEDEPAICDLIVDCFGKLFGAEIECARNGLLGARMIAGWHFDLAVIDAGLPHISGLELAGFAANENIPVLLVSGHPGVSDKLRRFSYPYLEKPFGLDALCAEAARVIDESRENIRRVKASAARMLATTEALSNAMMESRRLLREIKAQQIERQLLHQTVASPLVRRIDDPP
jgi:DNA-binding response OmpR family regulator